MRAYVVQSRKTIEPFEESPRDCLIGNRTLKTHQESVLQSLGIDCVFVEDAVIEDPEEHVVFTDSLYFNRELLSEFIARSRGLNRDTVCALKPGLSTLRTVVTTQDVAVYDDRVEYDLRYRPGVTHRGETVPVIIEVDQLHEIMRMPEHMTDTPGHGIPLPEKLAVQIDHWTNLWAANMASLLASVAKVMLTPKWKLLGKVLKAGSMNQWRVASKMNRIGSGCDIHPTAYVEGSVIGDNVTIGAGSVVRECNIADDVSIENHVTLNFSVIGARGILIDGAVVRFSVIYPDTCFAFSTLSCQLLGRSCFIGDGVTMTDFRFDRKNITVLKSGTVVDTGNRILGSCIGHGTYLGAGTVVAPGRAIPNGSRIVPEDRRIIHEVPEQGAVAGYRRVDAASRPQARRPCPDR